jgi:4-amino-4-deoxy-L-arabinose transferase-like glycosyltransferase
MLKRVPSWRGILVNSRLTGRDMNFPEWIGEAVVISCILILALVLRQVVYVVLFTDSISYLAYAKNILARTYHGSGITMSRYLLPPLYPHLVALFAGGNSDPVHLAQVGRLVSVFSGALVVVPVYLLARIMAGVSAGVIAGVLIAILPESIYYSGAVLTESLATFFVSWALFFLWASYHKSRRRLFPYAIIGILLGLAFLTRHATIGFLGLGVLLVSVQEVIRDGSLRSTWKITLQKVLPAGLILAGFFLVIMPQVLYLHSETGRWTLTGNFRVNLSASMASASEDLRFTLAGEATSSLTPDGRKYVHEANIKEVDGVDGIITAPFTKPVEFLKAYMITLFGGYLYDTKSIPYPLTVLLLSLLGIILCLKKGHWQILFFLIYMFGGFYMFLALFHNMRDRYMFPVLPVLIVLAAIGGSKLIQEVAALPITGKKIFGSELLLSTILVLMVFGTVFPASFRLVSDVNSAYDLDYYKGLRNELSRYIEPDTLVFDRMPHRAFFAGGEVVRVPHASVEKTIDFGRYRGVRYWIVSFDYVPKLRPQFTELLREPEKYKQDLKPLALYGQFPKRTILFEILP